jgi:hypothetical protein
MWLSGNHIRVILDRRWISSLDTRLSIQSHLVRIDEPHQRCDRRSNFRQFTQEERSEGYLNIFPARGNLSTLFFMERYLDTFERCGIRSEISRDMFDATTECHSNNVLRHVDSFIRALVGIILTTRAMYRVYIIPRYVQSKDRYWYNFSRSRFRCRERETTCPC